MTKGQLKAEARRAAVKNRIPVDLFLRQIGAESGWNTKAVSPAGARGVAQFMPGTAAQMGVDPDDPVQALHGAAKLMRQHVDQFGSYRDALVAYNAWPGRVGKPLYDETRKYVEKIMRGRDGKVAARQADETPQPAGPGALEQLPDLGAILGAKSAGGHAELDAALALLDGKTDALGFAMQVQGAREQEAAAIAQAQPVPQQPQPKQPRGADTPGELPKLPKGLQGLIDTAERRARRLGLPLDGSGHRTEQRNAEVGGADDSDHLWHRGDRWGKDYPARGSKLKASAAKMGKRFGIHDWDGEGERSIEIRQGKDTYRVQLLAGASVDHDDHLHVGIRKVS